MHKTAIDGRPLVFAACAVVIVLALTQGPAAQARDRRFQTVPTPTPRITLPPPGTPPLLPTAPPTPGPGTPDPTSVPFPTPDGEITGPGQLVFTESVSHPDVLPGDEVVFKLWLANDSQSAITGLIVTDSLDAALRPIEIRATQGTAAVTGQVISVTMGALEAQQAAVVVIRTVVRSDVTPGQIIINQAVAYHDAGQDVSNAVAVALPPDRLPATGEH